MSYNFEERYKEIREQLIAQGYANKHVTYSEFLALYELYKEEMSEKEFASILGISYANWITIKYKNTKAVILKKDKTDEDREKLKQEIVSTLIERGYQNKSIDYTEFLKLYEPYRTKVKESEFASILGISYSNWKTIKYRNQRAVILKEDKTDEDREKLKQEIVSELIERGYQNKRIDYIEFLKLYEPYRIKLKESEFASILGISYSKWQAIKYKEQKAVILKKGDKIDEEKKRLEQEIVSTLIERGYQNKSIDYTEFLKLYEPYRIKLKESEFANILGISYGNWQAIKYRNQKAVILKKDKTDEDREKLKQEIVSELIERGYQNKRIDYTEFLKLYEPYRIKLKESEFASILGISYSNLQAIKHKNTKAIILKEDKTDEDREKLKQEIVSELIERGYQNKRIDYTEFLKLYEPYKRKLKESEFANILGISYANWQAIKYRNQKAVILKKDKTDEDREKLKQEIVSTLIERGYQNKRIDYTEFLKLYEPYRIKLKESEFASILGISYSNLQAIKHKNTKAIILKEDKTDEDREKLKQEIVSELIERGYQNKRIDYTEFLKLYEPYKRKLKESEFANILGISYANWQAIKYRNQKAVILKKDKTDEDREKLKQEIVSTLIERGYQNKRIDYTEFLKLYEPYRIKLKESEFASILGISYSNLQNMKYNRNQKTIIIKKDKTDEEKKRLEQEIVSTLIERGYQNKSIDYAEFLKLYEPYRIKLKESEFASILGISYSNLQTIKHRGNKSTINFEYKYSSRILYLFWENKEYELEYFEEVSKNLGLPIYKILEILTKERTNLEEFINALHTRGKIFIGQTRISDSFLQKYGEIISDDIHKYSKQIGKKLHTGMYAEDFAQEAILWVIDKKGNIERNFEEGLALERIIKYAKSNCKYMHFRIFSQKKVVSLDEVLSEDGKITRLTRVKSKENVQDSVEKREEEIEMSEDDTPITLIQRCLSNGMNREEALSFVMKKFNISKKELLETLTEELSKRNKIKVAETGEVYLGARDE